MGAEGTPRCPGRSAVRTTGAGVAALAAPAFRSPMTRLVSCAALALLTLAGCSSGADGPTLDGVSPEQDGTLEPDASTAPGGDVTPDATLAPDATLQPDTAAAP